MRGMSTRDMVQELGAEVRDLNVFLPFCCLSSGTQKGQRQALDCRGCKKLTAVNSEHAVCMRETFVGACIAGSMSSRAGILSPHPRSSPRTGRLASASGARPELCAQ